MPSAIRRSANSATMMASSTSMPTARIRLNSATILSVSPAIQRPRMPVRNDAGIAMPTKIDARPPSTNMMMTKTSSTPVITLFCRSARSCRMVFDSSWMKETWSPLGQRFCSCSTAFLTPSTVSMTLAPVRFLISIATAGRPSTRVIATASLKVGRISATSPRTTLAVRVRRDRNLQHVLRLLDQRRYLDREASAVALERAGRDQAVAAGRDRDEVVERDAVALEQHRLGDDLDDLVARALAGRPKARPAPARSLSPPRARRCRAPAPTCRRRAPSPGSGRG